MIDKTAIIDSKAKLYKNVQVDWKKIFNNGLFVKNLPKNKTPAKRKFIIVGFI